MSLYDVLGARPDATAEELRRAFVALARRYHPDRHVGAAPAVRREAEDKMRQVTEAWSVLGDPQRRRYYDLGLGDPVARGHRGRPAGSGPSAGGGPGGFGPGGGGPGGGSSATAGPGPRSTGAGGPRATAGAARAAAGADAGRHWRSYGGPGPGPDTGRSTGEQLLLLSPLLLLFGA
ncbi:MAG: J domain-containing protein, partial [Acidimicrobiia bacterium]